MGKLGVCGMKKKCKKGFTLVELVVVIAVLGIIAAIAMPFVINLIHDAAITAEKSDASSLNQACREYYSAIIAGVVNDSSPHGSTQGALPSPNSGSFTKLTAARNATPIFACEYAGLSDIKNKIKAADSPYVYDGDGNIYAADDRKDLTNKVTSTLTFQTLYNI